MSESDGLTSQRFMLQQIIGRFLDYPSVYMGGASPRSIRRADDLIRTMQESGFLQDDATLDARIPWPMEHNSER